VSEQEETYGRQGWKRTTLGDALPIRYGKARTEKHGVVREDTAVYGSSGIIDKFERALTNGPTLIIGRKGTVGATYYSPEPCWPIDTVYFAEADPDNDLRFFKYLLDHLQLGKMDRSTAVPGLSRDDYNVTEVDVPLLNEQLRIVAEVEKQFTRLEAGVAGLRRVQANLKRYRAAVLKAACEGKLVPTEGEWKQIPLKELIGRISQGWSPKCDLTRDALPHEWAIITTTAVQPMRYIDNRGKPLPSAFKPRPHIEIKAGDFLMTRKGPRKRAGVACLVRSTRSRLMVCDTVYRFRCNESLVLPAYLEVALNSPSVVDAIDRQKSGINDSGVSLTHDKLGLVLIPMPPIPEQLRIVAEVERRLSVAEELEAVVNANQQRTTRLSQSILLRAFNGEL
jgi:type I restriction enzyme S subunit